jgi:histone deacetylase complex regulatory component SIN3
MGFIDLSVIHYGENDQSMNKNNMSDKMSFLDQINTDEMNDMSIYST